MFPKPIFGRFTICFIYDFRTVNSTTKTNDLLNSLKPQQKLEFV